MSKMELRILRDVLEESAARSTWLANQHVNRISREEREVYTNRAEVCRTVLDDMKGKIRGKENDHPHPEPRYSVADLQEAPPRLVVQDADTPLEGTIIRKVQK